MFCSRRQDFSCIGLRLARLELDIPLDIHWFILNLIQGEQNESVGWQSHVREEGPRKKAEEKDDPRD